MALGTYNNSGNNSKKDYSPTTYSPVKFFNSESKVDPSALNFTFWKSLLKISIIPMKNKSEGSVAEMDKDNSIDIYLSPMKAKLFLYYCNEFRKDPNKFTNVGIGTNKGIIYLTSGKTEFGIDSLFVIIKLIDFENNGNVSSCIAYEFNTENYFGIVDYAGGAEFNKNDEYSKFIELDMFIEVIESYVSSSNYAIAATVVDNNKYDVARVQNKISTIQEKLGIEIGKKSYSNNNGGSKYWNNGGNTSNNSNTNNTSPEQYDNLNQLVDDISNMLIED